MEFTRGHTEGGGRIGTARSAHKIYLATEHERVRQKIMPSNNLVEQDFHNAVAMGQVRYP